MGFTPSQLVAGAIRSILVVLGPPRRQRTHLMRCPAHKEHMAQMNEAQPHPPEPPGYLLDLQPSYLHSCPYLGKYEDRRTSLAFPDGENHCHRLEAPVAIDLAHQRKFCLAAEHARCYVFQQAVPAPAADPPPAPTLDTRLRDQVAALAAAVTSRFPSLDLPFSDGFRLPFEFFSGRLTLPPDPWGRESLHVPENPFAPEFAALARWLRRGRESATAVLGESYDAAADFLYELPDLLRAQYSEVRETMRPWPGLLRNRVQTAVAYARTQEFSPATLTAALHLPEGLAARPASYLAFPLLLVLMLAASLVWWPLPGQNANDVTAHGQGLYQRSSGQSLLAAAAPAPADGATVSEHSPANAPTAVPLPTFITEASLNSVSDDQIDAQAIFGPPRSIEYVPAAADRSAALSAEPLPTAVPPGLPTAEPFVLAAPQPEEVTELPPTVSPPATPAAPPTVVPVAVPPTAVPTATSEPTPQPTATATEIAPVSGVAYIHAGALNLRSGPGLDYVPVAVAYNREEVYLLDSPGYEPWTLIRLATGVEGWVNAKYLRYEKPAS